MKQHAIKNEIFSAGTHLGIINLIKPFLALVPNLKQWKHFEFLMFSEYIRWEHWVEMSQYKQVLNEYYVII